MGVGVLPPQTRSLGSGNIVLQQGPSNLLRPIAPRPTFIKQESTVSPQLKFMQPSSALPNQNNRIFILQNPSMLQSANVQEASASNSINSLVTMEAKPGNLGKNINAITSNVQIKEEKGATVDSVGSSVSQNIQTQPIDVIGDQNAVKNGISSEISDSVTSTIAPITIVSTALSKESESFKPKLVSAGTPSSGALNGKQMVTLNSTNPKLRKVIMVRCNAPLAITPKQGYVPQSNLPCKNNNPSPVRFVVQNSNIKQNNSSPAVKPCQPIYIKPANQPSNGTIQDLTSTNNLNSYSGTNLQVAKKSNEAETKPDISQNKPMMVQTQESARTTAYNEAIDCVRWLGSDNMTSSIYKCQQSIMSSTQSTSHIDPVAEAMLPQKLAIQDSDQPLDLSVTATKEVGTTPSGEYSGNDNVNIDINGSSLKRKLSLTSAIDDNVFDGIASSNDDSSASEDDDERALVINMSVDEDMASTALSNTSLSPTRPPLKKQRQSLSSSSQNQYAAGDFRQPLDMSKEKPHQKDPVLVITPTGMNNSGSRFTSPGHNFFLGASPDVAASGLMTGSCRARMSAPPVMAQTPSPGGLRYGYQLPASLAQSPACKNTMYSTTPRRIVVHDRTPCSEGMLVHRAANSLGSEAQTYQTNNLQLPADTTTPVAWWRFPFSMHPHSDRLKQEAENANMRGDPFPSIVKMANSEVDYSRLMQG